MPCIQAVPYAISGELLSKIANCNSADTGFFLQGYLFPMQNIH